MMALMSPFFVPRAEENSELSFHLGFPCGSAGKESACNVGDLGLFPGLGRSPGEGKGYTLQYSGLENSMDYIVHGVTKSRTWLSDFHFTRACAHYYAILNSMLIYILSPKNRVFLSKFSCRHHHRICTTLCKCHLLYITFLRFMHAVYLSAAHLFYGK